MATDNAEFVEILRDLFDTYGLELLINYTRINALLMDLAPHHNKERKLIHNVLKEGIGAELARAVDKPENEQKQSIRKCIFQIRNETWIAEEAAAYAINILANSIGIQCDIAAPNRENKTQKNPTATETPLIKGFFAGDVRNMGTYLTAYTEIGYKAFAANTAIQEAVIPETIKRIKSKAFMNCTNLVKVQLPSKLESMGDCVFKGCSLLESISVAQSEKYAVINGMLIDKKNKKLLRVQNHTGKPDCQIPGEIIIIAPFAFDRSPAKNVSVPKSIAEIKENAFAYCLQLENIHVDPHNPTYSSVDGVLHNRSRTVLIRYPSGKPESGYIVEDNVAKIDEAAFSGAINLETITFTNAIKVIGRKAFEDCKKLYSVVIPASVEVIEERAFQHCDALSSVMLPRNMKEIGDFAFNECVSIKTISIPKTVQKIGHAAFFGCKNLQRITIQNNVAFLGDGVFDGCSPELEILVKENPYIEAYCRAHGLKCTKM